MTAVLDLFSIHEGTRVHDLGAVNAWYKPAEGGEQTAEKVLQGAPSSLRRISR